MNQVDLETWLPHRTRGISPTLLVLHATAGSTARSSIDHLRAEGLSYHYIIARDGRDSAKSENSDGTEAIIYRCVPDAGHAFHVGSTVPPPAGTGGINKNSIGVSLANIQRRVNPEPYTPQQLAALDELLPYLQSANPALRWLTTHAVVQPWNRSDPRDLNARKIAKRHGYEWWEPTADVIAEHKPRR